MAGVFRAVTVKALGTHLMGICLGGVLLLPALPPSLLAPLTTSANRVPGAVPATHHAVHILLLWLSSSPDCCCRLLLGFV